jgi:hypothetical protein
MEEERHLDHPWVVWERMHLLAMNPVLEVLAHELQLRVVERLPWVRERRRRIDAGTGHRHPAVEWRSGRARQRMW